MVTRKLCLLLGAAVFLQWAGAAAWSADIWVEENVRYGRVDGVDLHLDLARPEGDGPFPALIFIHGGGWHGGNRQVFQRTIMEAANRGYVAAAISYRLMKFTGEGKEATSAAPIFPAQLYDAKAAVRFLRANSARYLLDPERIGVAGFSSGGHLALLVGLTGPDDNIEGNIGHLDYSSRVQAVVNFSGLTDMVYSFGSSAEAWVFRLLMGGTPEQVPDQYRLASPMNYVSKDDPPVLTLHGDQDEIVRVDQARAFDEKMKAAGADHTLVVFEGQGHAFAPEYQEKGTKAMWNFFDKQLKK